jgi:hypothetical protein
MTKKIFFLLFIISGTSFSQSLVKYGNEFLTIGVGGKQLGMGTAGLSINSDVASAYWNPAGLSGLKEAEFILQHDERYGELVNFDYGAFAMPFFDNYVHALSIIRLGVDGIPDTRNALIDFDGNGVLDNFDRIDYSKVTYHNASDWAFIYTIAKNDTALFSYGMNIKFIYRDLMGSNAMGVGFDVGLVYSPIDKLFLGATIQDVTTTYLGWDTGKKELIPPTLKLGAGYYLEIFNGVLSPALDFNVHFDNRKYSSMIALGPLTIDIISGFEFLYKDIIALRAGYNDTKQITLGLGLKVYRLSLDYAFAKFSSEENSLGNTHRISLKLNLGNLSF